MTFTIGLIGCGYIAKKHITTISKLASLELVAVSDIDVHKMENAIQEYKRINTNTKEIKAYSSYEELLKDDQIDIVIIATGSSLHAKMAMEALFHNKHVILEKPLALSVDDALKVQEASAITGKRMLVCHQLRYRPIMRKLKSLLEKGALGKLYLGVASMRINRTERYYDSSWKGSWEKDGGMLLNQGIHLIDLLIWFMGDVHTVFGEIERKSTIKCTEDIALGILTFENGSKGIIETNIITQPDNLGYYLTIFGEKGTISIGGPSFNKLERCYLPNPAHSDELTRLLEDRQEHIYMYQHFVEALKKEDEVLLVNEKEAFRSIMTIFGLYQSALKTEKVTLPLEAFSTLEMGQKEDRNDS